MAWPFPSTRTPVNRARVLRRTAGFASAAARQDYYGWLRRMRATLVLSKREQS